MQTIYKELFDISDVEVCLVYLSLFFLREYWDKSRLVSVNLYHGFKFHAWSRGIHSTYEKRKLRKKNRQHCSYWKKLWKSLAQILREAESCRVVVWMMLTALLTLFLLLFWQSVRPELGWASHQRVSVRHRKVPDWSSWQMWNSDPGLLLQPSSRDILYGAAPASSRRPATLISCSVYHHPHDASCSAWGF